MKTTRQLVKFSDGKHDLFGSWSFPSSGSAEPSPVVVLATGDGKNGSEGQTWANLVPMLNERGIGTFLFDFTGLGHSPGIYEDLTLTQGCQNFDGVVRFVVQDKRVDSSRLGVIGASYGGNVALLRASEHPQIRAIGLKSPSSFLPEGYESEYGHEVVARWGREGYAEEVGLRYSAVLDSLFHNTFACAARINAPVRIVHGTADRAVPIRQSRDLVRVMKDASLYEIEGADHWYAEGDEWQRMATDLCDFMSRHLR